MTARLYELTGAEPPWGDYGGILVNGMAGHLPRLDGRPQAPATHPTP